MAKRYYKYFPVLFVVVELLVLWLMLFMGLVLNGDQSYFGLSLLRELGLFSAVWVGVVLFRKDFKLSRTSVYWDTVQQFLISSTWVVLLFFLLREQLQGMTGSEIGFLLYPISLIPLSFFRVGVHGALRRYRSRGRNYRKAAILGKDEWSMRLAHTLTTDSALGIKFMGYYDDREEGKDILGGFDQFFMLREANALDLVYLSEQISGDLVRRIVAHADAHHIKVKIIPGSHLQWNKEMTFSRYGSFVVVNVNEIPLDKVVNRVLKRVFDTLFSLVVILFLLSWLIPLLALLIKWESKGPVFFFQKRTGANNREFRCIKFRTMVTNPWSDTLQATKNDPRVTKVGAFLRRFSLDELPQFVNVLKGDMSVVGPRPHAVPMNLVFKKQIDSYDNRHRIKPGITGLAQVLGYRGEISNHWQIRSRVRLDHFYIRNWSFFLDLTIVYKTIGRLTTLKNEVY